MNTEIYVENYKIDITSDIDALMTFAIDDIKDFSTRNTSFSKTIVIPGSASNNKVFNNIFEIGQSQSTDPTSTNVNTNYNIAKSAKCIIFQGNMQIFKGIIRIMQIVIDKERVEYECVVFGELGGLISSLGNKKLTDLDISQYNHTYSIANIVSGFATTRQIDYTGSMDFASPYLYIKSKDFYQAEVGDSFIITNASAKNGTYTIAAIEWDSINLRTAIKITTFFSGSPQSFTGATITLSNKAGFGYYYPLIDYGTYSTGKIDWIYKTFRPALFIRELLILILKSSGYSYSSNFFNLAFFKKLVMPYNQKLFTNRSYTDLINANKTSSPQTATSNNVIQQQLKTIIWNTPSLLFNFSINSTTNTIYTYTTSTPGSVRITANFKGVSTLYYVPDNASAYIQIRKNLTIVAKQYVPSIDALVDNPFDISFNVLVSFVQNDTLSVDIVSRCEYYSTHSNTITLNTATLNAVYDPPMLTEYAFGNTIDMNDCLPVNILQKDFLSSIMKMFNLYLYEDKDKFKFINIEPYIDFYDSNVANAKDWTYKVDQSKPIMIKPMSELNARYYKFKYKDDSDFYNDQYKKRYNVSYGSKIFDTQYEFAKDDTNIDVIFSGTPLVGYDTAQKVYSTIFKRSGTTEETIDSNIRILQIKQKTGVNNWYIKDTNGTTNLSGPYTYYPYAGHFDDPLSPTIDLNFGLTEELYYTLSGGSIQSNLFSNYWNEYMSEIIDETSRLMICYMRLTEADIQQLDFSKFIYIKGILFRLNKIIDYNASARDICKVELLKVINTNY